ncbi:MAG: lactate dehydrogenase [Desulfobulbus propionicus]|nr:MAG: lactate dehydrogenase [Desulfobulbus propionicus]
MSSSTLKSLDEYRDIIEKCVKCGACQAHCPVYLQERKEGAVARGKIALAQAILDGDSELEERLQEDISLCLMCGSCVAKCPNRVPTDEIVGAVRRQITNEQGLSMVGRAVHAVTGSRPLMRTLARTGSRLQPALFKQVPGASGLRLRFPSPVMPGRSVPQVARRSLFNRVGEFVQGSPEQPTIGFFSGCSITYIYPEIGEVVVGLLQRLGFSVALPRDQGCCGIPALSSGDGQLLRKVAKANDHAFAGLEVEHVVTACASCLGGIGHHYATMNDGPQKLSSKAKDILVFLCEQGLDRTLEALPRWQNRRRVTYHDPCHLRAQGITREPRALLEALPNIDFVEMENAASCCGLGGTFSVYHYPLSKAIGEGKMSGLATSQAQTIATACPGCMIQLQDSINHAALNVQVVHVLDLVYQALKGPEKI